MKIHNLLMFLDDFTIKLIKAIGLNFALTENIKKISFKNEFK